jgi:hypothetical protein
LTHFNRLLGKSGMSEVRTSDSRNRSVEANGRSEISHDVRSSGSSLSPVLLLSSILFRPSVRTFSAILLSVRVLGGKSSDPVSCHLFFRMRISMTIRWRGGRCASLSRLILGAI